MAATATQPVRAVQPTGRPLRHPWGEWAGLLALLVLATALRFWQIGAQSLWYDEGVSAGMIGQGPLAIVRQAAADIQPPLYYLALAGWARLFGDSEVSIRGLSACAGVLLVLATWGLATRLFGKLTGWLAGGWAALSPLGIAFSQELRMYMPAAWLVTIAAWCALRWLDGDTPALPAPTQRREVAPAGGAGQWAEEAAGRRAPGRWTLAAYILAAAAGLYVQYIAAFGLAAIGLYGFWRVRGQRVVVWLLANLTTLLLFAPWLPVLHYQLTVGHVGHTGPAAQMAPGAVLSVALAGLLVGADGLPVANGSAVALLGLLVFLGALSELRRGARGTLPFLLILFPLAGVVAYAAWKSVYEGRYTLVALSGVAALGALGLLEVGRALRRLAGRRPLASRAAAALVVAIGGLAGASAGVADARYYVAPAHPHDDYRGLARAIARGGQPGDAVLLYPPGQDHVFTYYYRGPEPVVGLPLQRPVDPANVASRLQTLLAGHPRVWVVEYGAGEADPQGTVTTWLAGHAFLASHRWFGNAQLLLYAGGGTGPTMPLAAQFANGATLVGYAVEPATLTPGATLGITLTWRDDAPITARYTVFTHLLDRQNQVVAQHDGEPAGGTRPTTAWQPGQEVQDRHGMVLPAYLPPGAYTLELGMYLPGNGQRATILSGAPGAPVDHLLLGPIMVQPAP